MGLKEISSGLLLAITTASVFRRYWGSVTSTVVKVERVAIKIIRDFVRILYFYHLCSKLVTAEFSIFILLLGISSNRYVLQIMIR